MNIYSFNKEFAFGQSILQNREISAFNEINELTDGTNTVLYIGTEVNANWFKTFTNQQEIETSENIDLIKNRLSENDYEYLLIDSSQWKDNEEFFELNYESVYLDESQSEFENDIIIAKFKS